jgi:hypothetical protein
MIVSRRSKVATPKWLYEVAGFQYNGDARVRRRAPMRRGLKLALLRDNQMHFQSVG